VDTTGSQAQGKATEGPESESEPRVLTFKELQDLIMQGKVEEIPNNKKIPEDLNVREHAPYARRRKNHGIVMD
jgi:hypothetical protein